MVNKRYSFGWLLLPLALSGCLAQSNIQASYTAQQLQCQEASRVASEATVEGVESAPISVSQFSQCMNKSGWHVATPKAPAAAQPAPAQPQPQQAAQPAPVSPVENQTTQQAAPVPQAPAPQQPSGTAIYQPARPATMGGVYYGTGAGRQF